MSDDYYYFLPRSEAEVGKPAKVDEWVRSIEVTHTFEILGILVGKS